LIPFEFQGNSVDFGGVAPCSRSGNPHPLILAFPVHVTHSACLSEDTDLRNSLISLEFTTLVRCANSLIRLTFPEVMGFVPFERKGKGPLATVLLVLFGSISILPNGN
jgi:hypothetical protein